MSSSGDADPFEHLEGASNFGANDSEYSFASNNTGTQAGTGSRNVGESSIDSSSTSSPPSNRNRNADYNLPSDLDLDLEDLSLTDADIEAGLNSNQQHQNQAQSSNRQPPPHLSGLNHGHGHGQKVQDHHHQDSDLFDEELEKGGALQTQVLPPHSCSYCGIHNPSCVVKCLICNKW